MIKACKDRCIEKGMDGLSREAAVKKLSPFIWWLLLKGRIYILRAKISSFIIGLFILLYGPVVKESKQNGTNFLSVDKKVENPPSIFIYLLNI